MFPSVFVAASQAALCPPHSAEGLKAAGAFHPAAGDAEAPGTSGYRFRFLTSHHFTQHFNRGVHQQVISRAVLPDQGFPPVWPWHNGSRCPIGLLTTAASDYAMRGHKKSPGFVPARWNTRRDPHAGGYFGSYDDGLQYLFCTMRLRGKYRLTKPGIN